MNARRFVVSLSGLLCAGAALAAQPQWRAPRTADGHPDLQGMWTSATITPLERPEEYGGRRALTTEEAARLEHAEASLVSNSAKPTDLNQHPNSPGYRLILNNVLFPAAKKKKQKT